MKGSTIDPDQRSDAESLERDIRSIHHLLIRLTKPSFVRHNLSPPRFWLLLSIQRNGPIHMAELCRHTHVGGSTLTTLVDGLESQGLVERYRIAQDRRKVFVGITRAGVDRIEETRVERQSHLEKAVEGLSAETRATIVSGLRSIREQLNTIETEAGGER